MTLPTPISSTVFADGELTNEVKWYTRIFTVINNLITYLTSSPFITPGTPYGGSSSGTAFTQAVTVLGTTDGSGNLTVSYPTPFPNGLVTVVVSLMDVSTAMCVKVVSATLSTATVKAFLSSGAAATSVSIRVALVAVGS